MKEESRPLQIYQLSHPMMTTEWLAILGDKYQGSLKVAWEFTDNIETADVIVWDGVITSKLAPYLEKVLNDFVDRKVLLLVGEALTLLRDHKMVKLVNLEKLRYVEVSGWSVLPEEILAAIDLCYKKLKHV